MQTFDQSTMSRVHNAPPLTSQSLEYGRKDMPFMAFGGTEKPRVTVQEYMKADSGHHKYDVNNKFGPFGKGSYKFHYGDTWGGEPQIYDTKNVQEMGKANQMKHMTLAAKRHENMTGDMMQKSGAVINKGGKTMCTPGYVMKNGTCVMEVQTPICQPGWYKQNGVCVKSPKEFMAGAPTSGGGCADNAYKMGAMGSAPTSNEYPPSKDDVLSMKRLRQYMQEKQVDSTHNEKMSAGHSMIVKILVAAIGLMFFIFILGLGAKWVMQGRMSRLGSTRMYPEREI